MVTRNGQVAGATLPIIPLGLAGCVLVRPELCGEVALALRAHQQRRRSDGLPLSAGLLTVLAAVEHVAARVAGAAEAADQGASATVAARAEAPTECSSMSAAEAAEMVELTEHAVRLAARKGRLRGVKVNGSWRFTRLDVEAWRASSAA